jgi:SAM-dependent methyltransferase
MNYREVLRPCIICGNTTTKDIWDSMKRLSHAELRCKYLIKSGAGKFYHMKVVICTICGLIYTNPMLDEETLEVFYKEEYRKIFAPELTGIPVAHARSALRTLREIEKETEFKTVLDVGCGPAKTFVTQLRRLKYAAEGLDPDRTIREVHHNLDDISTKYDVVTCFNTLEHLYDPITFLRNLKRVTRKCLVVGVPNVYGQFNCYVDAWFSKAHLWHFSDITLGNILRLAGYGIHSAMSVQEPMGDKLHFIAVPLSEAKDIKIRTPRIELIQDQFKTLQKYQDLFLERKYAREK